jgi:TolB-like protein
MRLAFTAQHGRLVCTVVEATLSHKYEMPYQPEEVKRVSSEMIVSLGRGLRARKLGGEMLADLRHAGEELWRLLVPGPVRDQLLRSDGGALLIDLDEVLVAAPWELLHDGQHFLCRKFSMGRTVATQQPRRRVLPRTVSRPVKMLVVAADPQGDLETLDDECRAVLDAMDDRAARTRLLRNAQAAYVRRCLKDYDVVHFAGHADYMSEDPEGSGWRLVDGKLTARDVVAMADGRPMPAFVFSNGCRSASTDPWDVAAPDRIYGLANAFLLAGVKYYLGTQWDVVDRQGARFAQAVYSRLAQGASIGRSVRAARESVVQAGGEEDVSWASYVLYGDPKFTLLGEVAEATPHPDLGPGPLATFAPLIAAESAMPALRSGALLADIEPEPKRRTVAVLPAKNTGEADDAYLAAAFSDDLVDLLATSKQLSVVSRAAAARAMVQAHGDILQVAKIVKADVLVEAELGKHGDRIAVVARLIDGETGRQLLTVKRENRIHESLSVDAELASAIAAELEVELGLVPRSAPADDVAIDRYLRARAAVRTYSMPELRQAVEDFEAVVASAPLFAPALAGVAQARVRLWMAGGDDLDRQKAAVAAKRALSLDPTLDEARVVAAWLSLEEGTQTPMAARALADVARRCPTNALAQAHLAWLATELGELERAFRALERAELVEPAMASASWIRASALARAGKMVQAVEYLEGMRGANLKNPALHLIELRFAHLAGLDDVVAKLVAEAPEEPIPRLCVEILRSFAPGVTTPAREMVLEAIQRIPSRRIRNLVREFAAEVAAKTGQRELARRQVVLAVADGLADAHWIETCPLLADLRASGKLEEPIAHAREQARALKVALGFTTPPRS